MGAQVPLAQLPLQQLLFKEQAPSMPTHCWFEQMPLSQRCLQQSLLSTQAWPAGVHATKFKPHTPLVLQTP